MPADDRFRLDDEKRLFPSGPEPAQDNPEELVRHREARFWMSARQDRKLLPQGQVLKKKIVARRERAEEQDEQEPQQTKHEYVVSG